MSTTSWGRCTRFGQSSTPGPLAAIHTSASEDIDAEVPADSGDSPAVLVDAPSQAIETVETLAPATRRPSHSMFLWCAGGVLALAIGATWWQLARTDYFWGNPLAAAQFQNVTDSGTEQAAALSRDGRFAAFLSERDGKLDVWVTQLGAGRSYNLTRGHFQQLANPSLRTLGFSPDGSLVTFWARGAQSSDATEISVWAVPTLGGQPTPYLEGVAEFDWSGDGSRLVYHTPGPGDPTFVKEAGQQSPARQIFAAAAGLHAHFPLWSQDGAFIYFVQGTLPDSMDVWRIRSTGGPAERITQHNARVSHPVLLNGRTLMYLASDKDGSGPWLHVMDVERRVPHRVGAALDRYTSLARSADGQRLVATLATPKGTLWRLGIADTPVGTSAPTPIPLTTGRGFSPRLGPDYLLYVSSKGSGDVIWKLADGATTELWSAPDARIIGGPEIAPDGRRLAFSADQHGKALLYVINADGTNARVVNDSLELRGTPAWTPDGRSITSAADVDGTPHLFNISLDGQATPLVRDYAVDPVWSPAGDFARLFGRGHRHDVRGEGCNSQRDFLRYSEPHAHAWSQTPAFPAGTTHAGGHAWRHPAQRPLADRSRLRNGTPGDKSPGRRQRPGLRRIAGWTRNRLRAGAGAVERRADQPRTARLSARDHLLLTLTSRRLTMVCQGAFEHAPPEKTAAATIALTRGSSRGRSRLQALRRRGRSALRERGLDDVASQRVVAGGLFSSRGTGTRRRP